VARADVSLKRKASAGAAPGSIPLALAASAGGTNLLAGELAPRPDLNGLYQAAAAPGTPLAPGAWSVSLPRSSAFDPADAEDVFLVVKVVAAG
jgi:hypothetical protein